MAWLVWLVGGLLVVLIAAAFVVITNTKLANTVRRAVFDIEECTTFVADSLPDEVAGRLSYDEVRHLIRWQLTYFRERGVATYGGVDHDAERAALAGVTVVADEDELVDELLFRARHEGIEAEAVDIVCVTDLVHQYLRSIGGVGPVVDVAGELEAPTRTELPETTAADDADVL